MPPIYTLKIMFAHELIELLLNYKWYKVRDHHSGDLFTPENVSHLYLYEYCPYQNKCNYRKRIPFNSVK